MRPTVGDRPHPTLLQRFRADAVARSLPLSGDMSYDLRREPWIPFRRRSGRVEWGPPALLTDRITDDPVVALAAPRPDFDGALHEFLVGLLTVALGPADEAAWQARWDAPPSPGELQAAFDRLPNAFDLDGDGPRFLQDLTSADFEQEDDLPIDQLLINAPGGKTLETNRDLFVKRATSSALTRPAAAMALLTLQYYAPEGGRGHLTSMRGGGPLTTLADPRVNAKGDSTAALDPLWQLLWANVETTQQWAARTPISPGAREADVFPWLERTRQGGPAGVRTTPADVNPLQAYFPIPRRVRLQFGAASRCAVLGKTDDRPAVAFRRRPYGVDYDSADWRHPLSPYRQDPKTRAWRPVRGPSDSVGWRDWVGLTLMSPRGALLEPAQAVAQFVQRAQQLSKRRFNLRAFGYQMDSNSAMRWTQAIMPGYVLPDENRITLVYDVASRMVIATDQVASDLLSAVERALYSRPKDAPGDRSAVKAELWAATEAPFYAAMARVTDPATTAEASRQLLAEFHGVLERTAGAVFDRWCPATGLAPQAMRRAVAARYGLVSTLRGFGKFGEKLYTTLDLPSAAGARGAGALKPRARKVASA